MHREQLWQSIRCFASHFRVRVVESQRRETGTRKRITERHHERVILPGACSVSEEYAGAALVPWYR
jgi:hypothetical protein